MTDDNAKKLLIDHFDHQEKRFILPDESNIKALKAEMPNKVNLTRFKRYKIAPIIAACLVLVITVSFTTLVLNRPESSERPTYGLLYGEGGLNGNIGDMLPDYFASNDVDCGTHNGIVGGVSESVNENSDEICGEDENQYAFSAPSVSEFLDELKKNKDKLTNLNKDVLSVLESEKLKFDNYSIKSVWLTPAQEDKGKYERFALELYWHFKDCTSCVNYCEKFRSHFIFDQNGIDIAFATKGYKKTETDCFYEKEISNNKTAYVYIINDRYYCRFVINNDLSDKESVKEQLKELCFEIKAGL